MIEMAAWTLSSFRKIGQFDQRDGGDGEVDGSNASVYIDCAGGLFLTGSRTRWITPTDDNYNFAKWAEAHKDELIAGLRDGHHFWRVVGRWYPAAQLRTPTATTNGSRLFNVARWHGAGSEPFIGGQGQDPNVPPKSSTEAPACCGVVPLLYRGEFSHGSRIGTEIEPVEDARGLVAVPGFT